MAGGFDALGLSPDLLRGVDEIGWNLPSDVQDETIPLMLGGGDVMVASATGSGKTGAFALPIIELVHERRRGEDGSSGGGEVATAKGSPPAPAMKFEMSDHDHNLQVAAAECWSTSKSQWAGGRASAGLLRGAAYFDMEVMDAGPDGKGICRMGWATSAASYLLGTDQRGYGYGAVS